MRGREKKKSFPKCHTVQHNTMHILYGLYNQIHENQYFSQIYAPTPLIKQSSLALQVIQLLSWYYEVITKGQLLEGLNKRLPGIHITNWMS